MRVERLDLSGRTWFSVLLMLASFVCCGCGQPAGPAGGRPPTKQPAGKSSTAQSDDAAAANVSLRTVSREAFDEELAKHKGKVVLVDYWATWCTPCTENFPHTVQLHEKYADRELDVISLSLDYPSDDAKVKAFLSKQKATFTNLLSEYETNPEAFEHFELETVPHYVLYDRQGELRAKWDGKPEGVEQKIEELLREMPK